MVNMWILRTKEEITLGYSDMYYLRREIAILYDAKVGMNGELTALYEKLLSGIHEGKAWWDDYNKEIDVLEAKYKLNPKILNFLYASDCEGSISYGTCHLLYDLTKGCSCPSKFAVHEETKGAMTVADIAQFLKRAWENKSKIVWC